MESTNGEPGTNPASAPADPAQTAAEQIPTAPTAPVAATAPTVPYPASGSAAPVNPHAAQAAQAAQAQPAPGTYVPPAQPNPYAAQAQPNGHAPTQPNAYPVQGQPNPYASQAPQGAPYAAPTQPNPYATQAPQGAPYAAAPQGATYGAPQGAAFGVPQPGQYAPQPGQYASQPGQYGAQFAAAPAPLDPNDAAYAYQQAAYAYHTALAQNQATLQRRKRRATFLIVGAFATAAVFGVATAFGIAAATGEFSPQQTSASSNGAGSQFGNGLGGSGSSGQGQAGQGQTGNGLGGDGGGFSFGQGGSGGSDGNDSSTLPSATAAQEVGIVDVNTQLALDNAAAAGTGLVLTSNGEILTNNHVVEGSTSISVTVISTGRTYTAKVVGTDATDDIAVLKLSNASGLATANIDRSDSASVGDSVTGVGNAGGTGGTPSASAGKVTALNQSITTQAEESAKSETLHGLIQTNADIEAGDSGGPLYNSSDKAIGIDTAASEGGSETQGYAIPISTALSIASQIEAGHASSTISIGYPAFLGIEVAAAGQGAESGTTAGASVAQVIEGTPAESAGLEAGDTITGVNGTAIGSASDLTSTLANFKPGQSVTITWVDQTGATQSASVTLAQGPVA